MHLERIKLSNKCGKLDTISFKYVAEFHSLSGEGI